MTTEIAVEKKVEPAVTQQETVATPSATEVDYEAILAENAKELAKVREEKENYRKGMLKAKGKLPPEEDSDDQTSETSEEMVRRITREELLSTKEAQILANNDTTLKAVLKHNKELTLALKNRGQITQPSGEGSNQDKPEGKIDNYFSNEQIAAFSEVDDRTVVAAVMS